MTPPLTRFRRGADGPRIFGHRGASAHAPENTLAAFARAMDDGADGVELDTRRCASGELVVIHDATLRRTTGDPRAVRDVSFAALRTLDAGAGERIPSLDEAIALVVSRAGLVNIEVKADGDDRSLLARRVVETLASRSPAERESLAVSCFDPRVLFALRRAGLSVPLLFLFEDSTQGRWLARTIPPLLRPEGINPEQILVTTARVNAWHQSGLLVTPWTIDDPVRARTLDTAGVDGLITNDPAATREALRTPQ